MGYIPMCGPEGYGFSAVINGLSILSYFGHFGHKEGMVLYSSVDMGIFLSREAMFSLLSKRKSTKGLHKLCLR